MENSLGDIIESIFKNDKFLLGISWIGTIAAWQLLPLILSSIASAFIIYNQYQIAKKKKK